MRIEMTPIGVVRTSATESDVRAEQHDIEGELEVFPEFAPALDGIDGYSHLFVICCFDQLRRIEQLPMVRVNDAVQKLKENRVRFRLVRTRAPAMGRGTRS